VDEPERSHAELRRVLQAGGTLRVLEHVRAEDRRGTVQDAIEPVWRRLAAGCHPNRRTEALLQSAGFAFEEIERRDLGATPLIAGVTRSA
jgi:hypothetical protein